MQVRACEGAAAARATHLSCRPRTARRPTIQLSSRAGDARGIQPNMDEARKWYERARELGAPEAEERLARLGGG